MAVKRPTIAAVKAHVADGLCAGNGWRTDFSFFDHDKSTDAKARIASMCEYGHRPCADHQCYYLADNEAHFDDRNCLCAMCQGGEDCAAM
jgi:hypothetical protein